MRIPRLEDVLEAFPTARPRSKITGERMEKIHKGPNWEEILGGEFAKRGQDTASERASVFARVRSSLSIAVSTMLGA